MKPSIIALAADSIVYAPLYIAQEAGLFASNPVEFGVIKRPSLGSDDPPRTGTPDEQRRRDTRALEQAMRAMWTVFDADKAPLLTVCDPMHALLYRYYWSDHRVRPSVVGAMLVRPACWLFDGATNLQELLSKLKNNDIREILTHPPGMTADTLIRWTLLNRKFTNENIRTLIAHVSIPGDELDEYKESDVYGNGTLSSRAAVSVDLVQMNRLEKTHPGKLGICYYFGENKTLRDYFYCIPVLANTQPFLDHGFP